MVTFLKSFVDDLARPLARRQDSCFQKLRLVSGLRQRDVIGGPRSTSDPRALVSRPGEFVINSLFTTGSSIAFISHDLKLVNLIPSDVLLTVVTHGYGLLNLIQAVCEANFKSHATM